MDQVVFQDAEIGQFINENYVSVKINAGLKEQENFRKRYDIRGFPSALFLNPAGEEIDRIGGFDGNKDPYFEKIKEYTANKNTLKSLLSKITENPDDVDLNYQLAMKHVDRWEGEKSAPYFQKVVELDPDNEFGHTDKAKFGLMVMDARANGNIEPLEKFMAKNTDPEMNDIGYETIIRHYRIKKDNEKVLAYYETAMQKVPDQAKWMIRCGWYIIDNKMEEKYQYAFELAKKIIQLDSRDIKQGYYMLGDYYEHLKDFDGYTKNYKLALAKFPDDASLMNRYAWGIYKNKLTDKFDHGVELAQKAVKLDPGSASKWDTLAWLYFESGEKDKALKAMRKAVELRPDSEGYKQNLEKMEKGIS